MNSGPYVIYRFIHDRVHYWDTCGWTRNLRVARAYAHDEAREVMARMSKYGRVMMAPLTRRAWGRQT